MSMETPKRRGRPPIAIDQRLDYKRNSKNVTLEADLVQELNEMADQLVAEFGFRPTLSQTVRHLIVKRKSQS